MAKDDCANIRCITDASRPKGRSINNYMENVIEKFSYVAVKNVAKDMTWNCYMFVLDVKNAYRTIPVWGSHRTLQGFRWKIDGKNEFLINNSLAFGLKSAPYIFTQFTEFIVRCMKCRGFERSYGYLDDFVVMEDSEKDCWEVFRSWINVQRKNYSL